MTNHTTLSAANDAALAELQRDLAALVAKLDSDIDRLDADYSAAIADLQLAQDRVAGIEWLLDGARLPSGRVVKLRWLNREDQYIAYDDMTGERVAAGDTEARVWQRIEDLVREGEIG